MVVLLVECDRRFDQKRLAEAEAAVRRERIGPNSIGRESPWLERGVTGAPSLWGVMLPSASHFVTVLQKNPFFRSGA